MEYLIKGAVKGVRWKIRDILRPLYDKQSYYSVKNNLTLPTTVILKMFYYTFFPLYSSHLFSAT